MTETSKPDHAYVLGVDPGTTTGLALVSFYLPEGRPSFQWGDQRPWDEACAKAELHLGRLGARLRRRPPILAAAACEKFTLSAQSAQRGQKGAEDALGMNGVIRRACQLTGVTYARAEQASAAKKTVSDEILKSLGLYAVGMTHTNDAMRHALLYGIKAGWMKKRLLAAALQ